MAEQNHPDRVLLALLYISTAVTGLIDAVSFLGLGHIFTANMTGNIVVLGFATAGKQSLSVPRSLSALAAFLVGALISGRIAASIRFEAIRKLAKVAFGIEALLLLSATLAAIGLNDASVNSSHLYAVILLTALAMGFRNAAVRKMAVPDLTTTVLTMTVTGLAADSSLAGGTNSRWQRRLSSALLMFLGAAAGALLVKHSLALPLAVATLSSFGCLAVLCGVEIVPRAGTERTDRTPSSYAAADEYWRIHS
jgi:uncharacterized membrane protein YoaK (UPF0700 family)